MLKKFGFSVIGMDDHVDLYHYAYGVIATRLTISRPSVDCAGSSKRN
jgi:hypothetical protein